MDSAFLELAALLAASVGLVGVLLGLPGVLNRRKGGWLWQGAFTTYVGVLVACGWEALRVGLPMSVWMPVLALAGACLIFQSLRFDITRRMVVGLLTALAQPRGHAAVLLAVCPLVALWCGVQLTPASTELDLPDSIIHPERMTEVSTVQALTDRGTHLPMYAVSEADAESAGETLDDVGLVRDRLATLIRTAPPDVTYNCHGWVFGGGLHWIKGRDVDAILEGNGYLAVAQPQVGDVIVYRNGAGEVLHTGLVRVAEPSLLLIESKWGALGRYVHRPEEQCYGDHFGYYRSSRQGHVLLGLNPSLPSSIPASRPRRAG